MKRKSFQLIAVLLLAVFGLPLSTVHAQEVQVTVMPKMDPMPPQVMNYISQPGNYFNITLNNTSNEVLNVFLTLEVEQIINGELHISTPYYIQPNAPIMLMPNSPTPVTSVALQSQFRQLETTDIVLTGGQLSDFYGTGIVGLLPEATYKAYIRAYKWEPGVKYPQMVSNPMAGQCTFNVCYSAQSPEITVPFYQPTQLTVQEQAELDAAKKKVDEAYRRYQQATGKTKAAALAAYNRAKTAYENLNKSANDEKWQAAVVDNAAATFSWTVPILNCGGIPKQYTYDLEFFPINSAMKTPEQAVNTQIKAYTIKGLTNPTCILTPTQVTQIQQYGNTDYYVARVTASPRITNKNDINYSTIENDGHSQLLVFRFKEKGIVTPTNDEEGTTDTEEEVKPKDEPKEVVVDVPVTPAISDDVEEDADYIIFPPKLTTPDTSIRGILEENGKVELKWEVPEIKTMPANAKGLEYSYDVKVYKKTSLQSVEQALKSEPIIKKESLTALQYTIPWSDLKEKVKLNDNLVYAVTATITNEVSVSVEEDRRNIYQQSYADLSDKGKGMDDCYADASADITNRELAVFNEKQLRDLEVKIGQFPLTITNANLVDKTHYKGTGYVAWYPFGKGGWPLMINVEFDELKINSDKIVYDGRVTSCHEEEDALSSYIPYDIFDDCCVSDYLNSGSAEALGNKVDEYLQNNSSTAQYYKYAQSGAKFIDDMIKNQITVNLPVSLKKPLGEGGITLDSSPIDIQILSATFSPNTAAVSVLGLLAMPNAKYIDSDVAVFGAPRICIEPESFVPNGVTIALLSDFTLRDPETDFVFNLKAPTDFVALDDGCSMTFSSNGLDSLSFEADMTVPGLLKADNKGNIIEHEDPAVHIRAFIKDWDNWLGTIAMDNFQVEEAQGFTFEVGGSGISYDHSLTHNAKGFSLPADDGAVKYDKAAAGCDKNVLNWQGLYINKLGVILPSFFDDEKGGTVEIAVKSLLYDDSGVSLQASVQGSQSAPIVKAHTSKAGGWGISLESVNLNVISNNFASTSIIGGIEAPIIGGEWEYKTSFCMAEKKKSAGKGLDILFTMDPREDPSFDFFLAKLELDKDYTHFKVHNFEEETDVEMQMAGKITIAGLEDASKKIPLDFSISGVEFTGMRLANFAPEKRSEQSAAAEKKFSYTFDPICEGKEKGDLWFDLGTWSLASPGKQLGPFNFSLDNFGITSKTKNGKSLTGVNIVGTVGLLGETFVATAGVTVWAELDIKNIKDIKVDYAETTLDKIAISSEFGGCKVAGSLEFAETDKKKGYAGSLEFTLPGDLFTMKAGGGFFNCTDDEGKYMSAYFVAEVGGAAGIPLGPIQLNNIAGGFFFNTSLSDTEKENPLEWKMTEQRGVHGGMFGLGISTVGSDRGVNAKVKMIVVYDAKKNRLSTFRMTGKIHALCVAPQAEDGLINADCSIVYQNLSSKEGGKFFQINITVDASGDMDQMVEQFTGQKFEMPDITAGLEEMEDKNGNKNKDAKDSKPKVSCGVHLSLDFKVTMRADDEPKNTKTKWHLYLGQPGDGSYESEMKNRCSITLIDFQVGGKDDPVAVWGKIWANAYLCIGNELPNDGNLPPIPQEIDEFLNGKDASGKAQNLSSKANDKRSDAVKTFQGAAQSGVMFGAQAGGEFGVNAVICYARASLLAGFDIVLKQLKPGTACNGKPAGGKGGFYGTGQVYALAKGELGLMLNLWIFKGKIPLIDVGLGALLQGGFPNPSWAYGKCKAKCKLLGGLIKFNGSITLEVGDVCYPDAGNPLDDIQIFGDMTPGEHEMEQGWTGREAQDVSCYATLGFTTNMAIGTRLDLVDVNKANRMAGRDGDPTEYYGNCHRAYKFYLEPQTEFYNFGKNKPTTNKTGGVSLSKYDYTTGNQEDYTVVVPGRKLQPQSYYMMVMKGYAKEIVNGREVDPVYNDESTNYKDINRPWTDADTVYFHTASLPNNLNQDVALRFPDNANGDHVYTDELAHPELHLNGSRVGDGDDIFDPSKYDIRARLEKKEHGIWVPADAKVRARSKEHYVDDDGNIDWFTRLNDDGTIAETQCDPFTQHYVNYRNSAGTHVYGWHNVIKPDGLGAERLHRYTHMLNELLIGSKNEARNASDYQKYTTLKWVPESYFSLLTEIDYYDKLLNTDGMTKARTKLNALKTEIFTTYDNTGEGRVKTPLTVIDADIAFTNCPVTRSVYNTSQADQALKDVTVFYDAGLACVDKGLTQSSNTRKSPLKLNPTEAAKVKDSVNVYYKLAFNKFSNLVPNIYCTEQSNAIKMKAAALQVLAHEADSLYQAITRIKTLRNEVAADKVSFLGLVADAHQFANPNHTLQTYREEMQEPFNHAHESQSKALELYPRHDYAVAAAMDYQAMVDTLELFDKWMTHKIAEDGAREWWEKGRKAWQDAVAYLAGPTFKSATDADNFEVLYAYKDQAETAWLNAKEYTNASTYTTEAKGFRDAIVDSIASMPGVASRAAQEYARVASRAASWAVTKAEDVEKSITSAETAPTQNKRDQAVAQRDKQLAECYEYVDMAHNAYYDATTDFRKLLSMKTDYTDEEFRKLEYATRQSINAVKEIKKLMEDIKAYGDKAQAAYDAVNAKAQAQNNVWNVVITNYGTMSKLNVTKIIMNDRGVSLSEAKILTDKLPVTVYMDRSKADAEGLATELTTAGAKVIIEKSTKLARTATATSGCNLVLTSIGSAKAAVIKAVQKITGLGLSDSKKLVEETLPVTILEGVSKQAAEDGKEAITAAGGTAKVTGGIAASTTSSTTTYTLTLASLGGTPSRVLDILMNLEGLYIYDDFTTKLASKTLPADMFCGLTKEKAEQLTTTLTKAGAKVTTRPDTKADNLKATLTIYNIKVKSWGTAKKTLVRALLQSSCGYSYDRASTILESELPVCIAEGVIESKANDLVKQFKGLGCTVISIKREVPFAVSMNDDWFKPTESAIYLASVPGVAEAFDAAAEAAGSEAKADPKPRARAKAKAEPEVPAAPAAPSVPSVPSAVAAGIISSVTSSMNAKSATTSSSSTAMTEPASAPIPDNTNQGVSASGQADGFVYDPKYSSANTFLQDMLSGQSNKSSNTKYDSQDLTYYEDASSVANSKLLSIPVTYHCGVKDANGRIVESSNIKSPNQQYHWLTIDGIDLNDYLNDGVQEYRIVIEQVDKVKLQDYIQTMKEKKTETENATLDEQNRFLANTGNASENGTVDLEAFMANYYQEMKNEDLMTVSDTTDVNKITNKKASSRDMFVQEIYTWTLKLSDYAGKGYKRYTNFAEYAKKELVFSSNGKPNCAVASLATSEGLMPLSVNYNNSAYSPRSLVSNDDNVLLTNSSYYLKDPYVWFAYVGGFAFFNSNPIYDKTDFLKEDINSPRGLDLTFKIPLQSSYQPARHDPYRYQDNFSVEYTNRGQYYGVEGYQAVLKNYRKAADVIGRTAPCYLMPTYRQCTKLYLNYDNKQIWTVADALEEPLNTIQSIMEYVREDYNDFQNANDNTIATSVQTWVSGSEKYSNWGATWPKYQTYLMCMVNWWLHKHQTSNRKTYNNTFKSYGTAEHWGDGRYNILPLAVAGGYNYKGSSYQFDFAFYCNNIKSIDYRFFRANCYDTVNCGYDVDHGRAVGFIYDFSHQNPLQGKGSKYTKTTATIPSIEGY